MKLSLSPDLALPLDAMTQARMTPETLRLRADNARRLLCVNFRLFLAGWFWPPNATWRRW